MKPKLSPRMRLLQKKHYLKTNNFDGKVFINQEPSQRSFKDFIKWMITRNPAAWPSWVETNDREIPPSAVKNEQIRVTFIHHSSFLIQVDNLNILTDPIWSNRCSPIRWLGPSLVKPPGLYLDELPQIDIILISHNHYDHMDIPTLKKLARKYHPIAITATGNGKFLRKAGLKLISELGWWEEIRFPNGLEVSVVPARHFSGRGLLDQNRCLWGGFILKTRWGQLYFAGDTGYGKHFRQIRATYGAPDLAILPIGCYLPKKFMSPVHMSPSEAVQAHIELGAKTSLGMHFGTFHLSDEAIDDPIRELSSALSHFGLKESEFQALKKGESWSSNLSANS